MMSREVLHISIVMFAIHIILATLIMVVIDLRAIAGNLGIAVRCTEIIGGIKIMAFSRALVVSIVRQALHSSRRHRRVSAARQVSINLSMDPIDRIE
jgi:hypothetical protein